MYNNTKNTLKELTQGMQRLCAVANRIVAQDGEPNRIEVDLLMDDLRRLYDIALRLTGDSLPEPTPAPEPDEVAEPKADERMMAMMSAMAAMSTHIPEPQSESRVDSVVIETPLAPAPEPEPQPQPETLPVEEELPAEEPEPEPTPEPEVHPLPEATVNDDNAESDATEQPYMTEAGTLLFDDIEIVAEAEVPEPEVAPTPKADENDETTEEPSPQGNSAQASLLDYLQKPSQRTLGESLATQQPIGGNLEPKVTDLRTVININDRFSFMSELFHNNIKAYNDFIAELNVATDREAAMKIVADAAAQQKWDSNSATVQTFHRILGKKF